jgi:hypothetical protein
MALLCWRSCQDVWWQEKIFDGVSLAIHTRNALTVRASVPINSNHGANVVLERVTVEYVSWWAWFQDQSLYRCWSKLTDHQKTRLVGVLLHSLVQIILLYNCDKMHYGWPNGWTASYALCGTKGILVAMRRAAIQTHCRSSGAWRGCIQD